MENSLAYKCMFHRFEEMYTQNGKPEGYDRARERNVGHNPINFKYFKEVYSSSLWVVRIYEVLDMPNREETFEAPNRRFFI